MPRPAEGSAQPTRPMARAAFPRTRGSSSPSRWTRAGTDDAAPGPRRPRTRAASLRTSPFGSSSATSIAAITSGALERMRASAHSAPNFGSASGSVARHVEEGGEGGLHLVGLEPAHRPSRTGPNLPRGMREQRKGVGADRLDGNFEPQERVHRGRACGRVVVLEREACESAYRRLVLANRVPAAQSLGRALPNDRIRALELPEQAGLYRRLLQNGLFDHKCMIEAIMDLRFHGATRRSKAPWSRAFEDADAQPSG